MASKKKEKELTEATSVPVTEDTEVVEAEDVVEINEQEQNKPEQEQKIQPKAKVGEIVYVSRDADSDLNGFKLFPQYKKYTYTVEDYDAKSDVYSLRRANLLLRLKGEFILRPEEKAHDKLNRIQF